MEISQILQSCRSKKAEDDFNKKFDFQDIIFPVKIGDIHKIEKKRIPSTLVFLAMEITKNIQFMYQKPFAKKDMLIFYE